MNPELALIGCALQDPRIALASKARPHHFADGRYGHCWRIIAQHADRDGTTLSPAMVVAELPDPDGLAAELVDAVTGTVVRDAEAYAERVIEASERRDLASLATKVGQMLEDGHDLEDVRKVADGMLADDTGSDELALSVQTADEFVDQKLPPEQWIIPDMLAAGDRLILTGAEGAGKSMLLRQLGMCVAAGCHPFARHPIEPSRVLVIDAENPLGIMVRKFRGIRDSLRAGGFETGDRLLIHRAPGGLDLTKPEGRTILRSLCRMVGPDVIVIGPIYKLYVPSSERDEVHARQVAAVLDEMRAEHNCAVLTEHHTPMAQAGQPRTLRPVGTGLWMRWPEFGLGITPEDGTKVEDRRMKLRSWRGSREERAWPASLQGAGTAPGRLPWADANNIGVPWRVA